MPGLKGNSHAEDAAAITTAITAIYNKISLLRDLNPRDEVNSLFSELVSICIRPYHPTVASSVLSSLISDAPHIRQLCSSAEGALERHWAKRMLRFDEKLEPKPLRCFPYYSNYVDLCNLECSTITAVTNHAPKHIAFIGSGPLPLTSFCVADRFPHARIHNVDRDAGAIALSEELAKRHGYGKMTFAHEEAADCGKLWDFDVVYVAALVGMSAEGKAVILGGVARRMRKGALLCVRSAHSLRALLYPVVAPETLVETGLLELVVEVHPWNHVVNSILLLRVL
ncbi:Nicotianamine synthase [Mytilinidion resinicola]|uniref:Nicotianamine synthase n=1 Tax=Mytilinidion resinicola TaxID=574789 RepID=A0A6A6Z3B7_9PEZI|nr:Nicotianamine synthase [Mytilinidion resinicola]KAF2815662.1 Nicotianamine synthase [Mytilinidion resinicola]